VSQSSEDSLLATYLPEEEGEPLHSCEEILDEVFSSKPDLTDTAISNANLKLFTDGAGAYKREDTGLGMQ
jgi:hypothetical protein